MPLHVSNIVNSSPAKKLGIKPGAILFSINGNHIEDIIDYQFYILQSACEITFQNPNSDQETKTWRNTFKEPFGLEFESPECKQCINNCIFCFVDQMPSGMRESLYVKDDDYLFSYMFGNFITLTNLTERVINKVIERKISPLYISVHTTNPELHKKMMNYNRDFNIIETLKRLGDSDIKMHTQLVLVPDYNDKKELERSLRDLTDPKLNVSSIGIVPVGLTKYSEDLCKLRTFTSEECQEIITISEKIKHETGFRNLFCSDEIFLNAQADIPQDSYYHEYEQIENGIGMVRKLWNNWEMNKERFFEQIEDLQLGVNFVTGVSGAKALNPIIDNLTDRFPGLSFRTTVVKNNYFGHSVTVTGLLTWKDIETQIRFDKGEIVAFSSNIFNHDDRTLDDISLGEIADIVEEEFLLIEELFDSWEIF